MNLIEILPDSSCLIPKKTRSSAAATYRKCGQRHPCRKKQRNYLYNNKLYATKIGIQSIFRLEIFLNESRNSMNFNMLRQYFENVSMQ